MTPDRIYIFYDGDERWYDVKEWEGRTPPPANVEYIRKDAILEWAENELERLYELIPAAHKVEDETATPMEMRYLGQYMQMESVIDKLNNF